ATIDGAKIQGKLGFLSLTIEEDAGGLPTYLIAQIGADIQNKADVSDDRLGFTELSKLKVVPAISAKAEANLDFTLALNSDLVSAAAVFPEVSADFIFEWGIGGFKDLDAGDLFGVGNAPTLANFAGQDPDFGTPIGFSGFGTAIKDGLQLVEFQNVGLDLGSFISDFLGPVLGKIQDVTEPLQPIIDFLTAPLPVISDLGPEVTFLDLAKMFSTGKFDIG
ncbi:MAG: hypothetical protein ACNA7G_08260, partial [Methylobacter sp.]